MKVGFIGLGKMGIAMARNLAKAGHAVHAWNRSPVSPEDGEGLAVVPTPAEAFDADVVFTMLADDAAIRAVLLESRVLDGARAGVVHVVTATISVDFAGELAALHAQRGLAYVAAPVFGRPDVAASAQLNIVAAGDPAAIATVQPLFDVIGRKTFVMGEDPRQANASKIAGNMMIALAIEAMAEAVTLTGQHGVAAKPFLDLMTQTLFGGRVYENYGAKIASGDYEAGFRMRLGLKDVRLAGAIGAQTGKSLPLLAAVQQRLTEAVYAGLGEKDWAALAQFTLEQHK
jgi:3-hydroxyisobutyrate dehydrogenase-like beta-hydroxyacid dehydrogenase